MTTQARKPKQEKIYENTPPLPFLEAETKHVVQIHHDASSSSAFPSLSTPRQRHGGYVMTFVLRGRVRREKELRLRDGQGHRG